MSGFLFPREKSLPLFLAAVLTALLFAGGSAPAAKKRPEVETESRNGLLTVRVWTPSGGRASLHVPEVPVEAGATISGTVIVDEAGNEAAVAELGSIGLDIPPVPLTSELRGEVTGPERSLNRTAPFSIAAAVGAVLVLRDAGGEPFFEHPLPIVDRGDSIVPVILRDEAGFAAPGIVQRGIPFDVTGPFEGEIDNTSATLGGRPVPPVAEAPGVAWFLAEPDLPVGVAVLEVGNGAERARLETRIAAVELNAERTRLGKGDRVSGGVKVTGLTDLEAPVYLTLKNLAPEVVTLEEAGGETRWTRIITPGMVNPDGNFVEPYTFVGLRQGAFTFVARLQQDPCEGECTFKIAVTYDLDAAGNVTALSWSVAEEEEGNCDAEFGAGAGDFSFRRSGDANPVVVDMATAFQMAQRRAGRPRRTGGTTGGPGRQGEPQSLYADTDRGEHFTSIHIDYCQIEYCRWRNVLRQAEKIVRFDYDRATGDIRHNSDARNVERKPGGGRQVQLYWKDRQECSDGGETIQCRWYAARSRARRILEMERPDGVLPEEWRREQREARDLLRREQRLERVRRRYGDRTEPANPQ